MNATRCPPDRLIWRTCPILGEPSSVDEAWLTGPERRRADAIAHPARKTRFVVGRALLRRTILELRPDLEGSALALTIASSGRPHLSGHPELSISISHTRGLAVAAASTLGTVGIDVEPRSRNDLPPVHAWLTDDEQRRLLAQPVPAVPSWLLNLWVAKEAVMKTSDPGHPIARVDLEVRDDGRGGGCAIVPRAGGGGSRLTMVRVRLAVVDGFVVAIATS
jgi:4'-phosphopantetheinyl transferase EntD